MSIRTGDIVETNYGTGPYRITGILDGCTCPTFVDSINLREAAPAREPHLHITCVETRVPVGKEHPHDFFYLNGYYEAEDGRVLNRSNDDELFVTGKPELPAVAEQPRQLSLF